MTVAVMQPYLFPYVGYFQLLYSADRFVMLDDVNFIKQGWINRNRIRVSGTEHMFTLPLSGAGSFVPINAIELGEGYRIWRGKFLRTLDQSYKRAQYHDEVLGVVERALINDATSLVEVLRAGVSEVMGHIGFNRHIVPSSSVYFNRDLAGQDRVIDICLREGGDRYINAIGGKDLYSASAFRERGIELRFIRNTRESYTGLGAEIPMGLSILDALMHLSSTELLGMMTEYELVAPDKATTT